METTKKHKMVLRKRKSTFKLPKSVKKAKKAIENKSGTFTVDQNVPSTPSPRSKQLSTLKEWSLVCESVTHFNINPDVTYVLIENFDCGYILKRNICYNIKVIYCSSTCLVECDGYVCKPGESVKVATLFGYQSVIRFIDNAQEDFQPNKADWKMVEEELKNSASSLADIKEKTSQNKAALLRIEVDRLKLQKYRLMMEYLMECRWNPVNLKLIENSMNEACNYDLTSVINRDAKNLHVFNVNVNEIFETINLNIRSIVLVYGPSGSGKSTLIHHLINRFISKNQSNEVFYLECDPGQTAFTPCGVLSLIKVQQKIQPSPAFNLLRNDKPVALTSFDSDSWYSKVLGATTAAECSGQYLAAIEQLLAHYRSLANSVNYRPIPLFINTMGWTDGVGLDLLISIIRLARPTHVIRIMVPEGSPKHPVIQDVVVTRNSKLLPDIKSVDACCRDTTQCKHWSVKFTMTGYFKPAFFKSAWFRRTTNQLAYLTANLWPEISYKPFFSLNHTRFNLACTFVHFINLSTLSVNLHLIHDLLNVSWVLLANICEQEFYALSSANARHDQSINILPTMPTSATCLGCGIIRSVDSHSVYITAETSIASRVNLIVIPDSIPIPMGLLSEQFLYQDSSSLPYTYLHVK